MRMSRIVVAMICLVVVVSLSACGTKVVEQTPPPSETGDRSAGVSTVYPASAETKNGPKTPEPLGKDKELAEAVNKTKADSFYVGETFDGYVRMLPLAVSQPNGFKRIADFLDAESVVYETERKRVNEYSAKGIKLSEIKYDVTLVGTKAMFVEQDANYRKSDFPLVAKMKYEVIYPDGKRESREEKKTLHGTDFQGAGQVFFCCRNKNHQDRTHGRQRGELEPGKAPWYWIAFL